jgi:hypothetical protein
VSIASIALDGWLEMAMIPDGYGAIRGLAPVLLFSQSQWSRFFEAVFCGARESTSGTNACSC